MNLPTELRQIIKQPHTAQLPLSAKVKATTVVKNVFLLETDSQKDGTCPCPNCCDGWIYAFLAISGPHKQVNSGHPIKWINDSWYIGYTEAYPCPDCSGESMDHILEHEPAVEGEGEYRSWDL